MFALHRDISISIAATGKKELQGLSAPSTLTKGPNGLLLEIMNIPINLHLNIAVGFRNTLSASQR